MAASHDAVATAIVQGQAKVMGGVALDLAQTVDGLLVDGSGNATVSGDGNAVLDKLVGQYSAITGPLGVRMCHTVAKQALVQNPDVQVPAFAGLS